MQPEWVQDTDYEGPDRRSGFERRKGRKELSGGETLTQAPAAAGPAAPVLRPSRGPASDREARLLSALLALTDGEALAPAAEHELLVEGLVARGSLAHGFQLTLRGTEMVRACKAADYPPVGKNAPREP